MIETPLDKDLDKDVIAEELYTLRYSQLSAWAQAQVDHIYVKLTRINAPHTQTTENEEPLRRRLAQVELENEKLRQDNFELELENDDLKGELEELRAEWNPQGT